MFSLATAARLFAQQPEGFDPHKRFEFNITGPNADQIKETLLANAKKAEDQWAEEHKFQGPKALDEEEAAFLQRAEDAMRIRTLEREIQELAELEEYQRVVKEKVYTIDSVQNIANSVPPPTKSEAPADNPVIKLVKSNNTKAKDTKKKRAKVQIISQTKRKHDEISPVIPTQEKQPKIEPKEVKEESGGLLGLEGYGSD
eukprot:TRINITY_DN2044_c0_g1_i2.p1 TRINITY_DN2044_c0_g1~~TRINITY_DN2044_c0_g1_i2.p1  ORF type:complete len:200 (+),score=63.61 TRINITY_DN2044_c0_g1_i2:68-667(+)